MPAKAAPTVGQLVERVKASRAQIAELQQQIIIDREAISAEVERIFPDARRGLTPRQREVLALVKLGKANKEIASALNISERTVKFHVSCLLSVFQKQDRRELMNLSDGILAVEGE